MGMLYSLLGYNGRTDDPDPVTGLTSRDKHLLKSTWELVKKDLKGNGVKVLMTFLEQHPEYQSYFPFKDMSLEDLPDNKKFQAHSTSVMYALSAIVDNIDNNDLLLNLLTKNAESHARRNIPAKSYWDLKSAALETLEKALGSKMTKEAKAAWDKALEVAMKVITSELETFKTTTSRS